MNRGLGRRPLQLHKTLRCCCDPSFVWTLHLWWDQWPLFEHRQSIEGWTSGFRWQTYNSTLPSLLSHQSSVTSTLGWGTAISVHSLLIGVPAAFLTPGKAYPL